METLKIDATKYSPRVEMTLNGEMSITGKSLIEDPFKFYSPIIELIKKNKSRKFKLDIHLEYMNTASSKLILMLLSTVKDYYNSTDVFIRWFYETGDEDMHDIGLDYESIVALPIDLVELCEEEAI